MPQKYQIVENYWQNHARLDIKNAASKLDQPCLFIHGSEDETVSMESVKNLANLNSSGQYYIIQGAGHAFGGKHPYHESELPEHSIELVETTINWFKQH